MQIQPLRAQSANLLSARLHVPHKELNTRESAAVRQPCVSLDVGLFPKSWAVRKTSEPEILMKFIMPRKDKTTAVL